MLHIIYQPVLTGGSPLGMEADMSSAAYRLLFSAHIGRQLSEISARKRDKDA